jgi:hypothetical protein
MYKGFDMRSVYWRVLFFATWIAAVAVAAADARPNAATPPARPAYAVLGDWR